MLLFRISRNNLRIPYDFFRRNLSFYYLSVLDSLYTINACLTFVNFDMDLVMRWRAHPVIDLFKAL
jgi:hypothetical protein